jgi:membrane protein
MPGKRIATPETKKPALKKKHLKTSRFKAFWQLLKEAASGFRKHKALKLSASLSFFTIFTLGPMLLVVIFISSLFLEREAVDGTIYAQISQVVGKGAALQIQQFIKNASISGSNFMAVVSIVILLIASTTVFTEMQDSINVIWSVKEKKGRGWKQMLKNRGISFLIIAGLGLLLLISLVVNGLLEGLQDKLKEVFPHIGIGLIYALNLVEMLVVVTCLFTVIFKVMPDVVIRWKDVIAGALVAAVLFMAGSFGIGFYINTIKAGSPYNSAGSILIFLLWTVYSSATLYYGVELTKAYAMKYGDEIKPKHNAIIVKPVQLKSDATSIQENERME